MIVYNKSNYWKDENWKISKALSNLYLMIINQLSYFNREYETDDAKRNWCNRNKSKNTISLEKVNIGENIF